jgi:hypothetical protein
MQEHVQGRKEGLAHPVVLGDRVDVVQGGGLPELGKKDGGRVDVESRKKMLELLQALAFLKKSRVERRASQFRSTVRWHRRRRTAEASDKILSTHIEEETTRWGKKSGGGVGGGGGGGRVAASSASS